jgi:hypothetical protein
MRTLSKAVIAGLALAALGLGGSGCAGPSARMKGEDEGTLVDVRKGGTETYKKLIHDTVVALLEEHRAVLQGAAEKPLVAFVGVENKSSEELGEFRTAMNNEITTALVNSRYYAIVSMRAVDAAKRESNIRNIDDLTTRASREAFMAVLNRDGAPPQYLLVGSVTTMTSRGNKEKERVYQLTLEMMDSSNGIIQTMKQEEVRKAYTD